MKASNKTPHYCNVDLDIESKHDLAALEKALGDSVIVLHGGPVKRGSRLLRLEVAREYENPDDTILAFCSLLERLKPKALRVWRSAYKKEFDVGYDALLSQHFSQFSLRTETLRRLSALGATLGVTFYYFPEVESKRSPKSARVKRPKK